MRIVTFASGSTGNCTLISDGGEHILVDAGISMKRIREALATLSLTPDDISGVFITHEHRDHTSALQTMVKRTDIRVFAPRTVANHLAWTVDGIERVLSQIPKNEAFALGKLKINAFDTSHDTPESVGYRISGTAEIGYCTDTGCVTEEMLCALRGVDAAVIESNHDEQMLRYGNYPAMLKRRVLSNKGHLSNDRCGDLAVSLCESGTNKFVLAHLSRENNRPDIALNTVVSRLEESSFAPEVFVAPMLGFCVLEVEGRARLCLE